MSFAVGTVRGVYIAAGDDFVTAPRGEIALAPEGIPGDRHATALRPATARDPWLPRGLQLRNDRQISMLSVEDLAQIAAALDLAQVAPELVGANIVVEGLDRFSRIPAGAHLAFGGAWGGQGRFDGAAILKAEAYNHPCRGPGRRLAAAYARPDLEFAFPKAARSLRGLVLSVSLAGVIRAGDQVVVVPPAVAP
jgi:hypothetical protein